MSKKVSITLDDEVLDFVDRLASNRSSFINDILWQEKSRIFTKELEDAYKDQANDPDKERPFLKEVASGKTKTKAKGTLWKMSINPQTGKFLEASQLVDRSVEFPSVNPTQVGQNSRYT